MIIKTFKIFKSLLTVLLLTLSINCFASTAGATGVMPYESWLMTVSKSLSGPVAFSIGIIGIITAGISLILSPGEIGKFVRTIVFIVFVMSLIVGANNLLTNLFNGAVI